MAILESRTQTGLSWVKESIALFKLQPSKWMLLSIAYVGIFMMLPQIPGLGLLGIFSVIAWPIFVVFAVMMFRSVELNKNETVQTLITNIQPKFKSLMLLGFACLLYAVLASYFLNGDLQDLITLAQTKSKMTESEYGRFMEKFFPFLFKMLVLLLPLFVATWFSPMLVVMNNYPVIKAVKSSIAGVLQYTVAMGVAWLVISAGVMFLMLVVGLLIGIAGAVVPIIASALMPLLVFGSLLFATAMMFAFQYVSYRDVFRAAGTVN